VCALLTGLWLPNILLLDVAIACLLASGALIGVVLNREARSKPATEVEAVPAPPAPETLPIEPDHSEDKIADADQPPENETEPISLLTRFTAFARRCFQSTGALGTLALCTSGLGFVAIAMELFLDLPSPAPDVSLLLWSTALTLLAAGLAATAVRYFANVSPAQIPEGAALARGARVLSWILVAAAISPTLLYLEQKTIVTVLHVLLLAINASVCYSLRTAGSAKSDITARFPFDVNVLSVLGNRANIFGSILDAGEQHLGIDVRSTWAISVIRRSLEPLAIGLCLVAWMSTALTVVGLEEQGLVERLGVPVQGQPLAPGLHVHWPWPIDRVLRIAVLRVQRVSVGHEGEEEGGPEDVLWARQHAANEYTLLLGNGRDLITIDAAVQFRITDPRAWRYNTQNPVDALRAIAYRAVMRSTVNRTLSEALSENVATLTNGMREMVQTDANALGLGVEILAFTVGGMHPPVMVASSYQAVISAEIRKATALVNAQVFRNQMLPAADAFVLMNGNTARAHSIEALAGATGEAWAFRTLMSQYHASPSEYFFRRRLETLEKALAGHHFTVVDARFLRDGGELWVNPTNP
jgi:regulator of protease activity HflC (stomatin/prohibitin superfamily)